MDEFLLAPPAPTGGSKPATQEDQACLGRWAAPSDVLTDQLAARGGCLTYQDARDEDHALLRAGFAFTCPARRIS